MSKIAIVYQSKRGTTKQYAQWIAEETGAELFEADACNVADLAGYDAVVFGGWIRAGGLQGIEFLKKNIDSLGGTKVYAYAVGLHVDGIDARQECREINFKGALSEVPCYFFRGAYDPAMVKGGDKVIMTIMKKLMGDRNPELQHDLTHGANYVSREEIKYLVEELKK